MSEHTERTMLDRLNVRYGKTYQNGDWRGHRYARAEHVKIRAGFALNGDRIADYIAIDTHTTPTKELTPTERLTADWGNRTGAIHGHEVKVSRSDWRTELSDLTKAEAWLKYCHYWWIVATPDVVRDDLPDGWGLMIPHGTSLRVKVQAARRDPEPMPYPTLASLARAIANTERRVRDYPDGRKPR